MQQANLAEIWDYFHCRKSVAQNLRVQDVADSPHSIADTRDRTQSFFAHERFATSNCNSKKWDCFASPSDMSLLVRRGCWFTSYYWSPNLRKHVDAPCPAGQVWELQVERVEDIPFYAATYVPLLGKLRFVNRGQSTAVDFEWWMDFTEPDELRWFDRWRHWTGVLAASAHRCDLVKQSASRLLARELEHLRSVLEGETDVAIQIEDLSIPIRAVA